MHSPENFLKEKPFHPLVVKSKVTQKLKINMTEIIVGESDDFEGTTINMSNLPLTKQQKSESHVSTVNDCLTWLKMLFVLPVVFIISISSFIRFNQINDYRTNILPCTIDCIKIANSMAMLIFPLSNLSRYGWRTVVQYSTEENATIVTFNHNACKLLLYYTAAINMILFIIFSNYMTLSFILYICWMLFNIIVSKYMANEVSASTHKSSVFWYLSVINSVALFIWSCFQIIADSGWYIYLDYIIWAFVGVLFISEFNLEHCLHLLAFNGPISSFLEKMENPHHVRHRKWIGIWFMLFFVSCCVTSFVFWIKYSWLLFYR
eukprot:544657_1